MSAKVVSELVAVLAGIQPDRLDDPQLREPLVRAGLRLHDFVDGRE